MSLPSVAAPQPVVLIVEDEVLIRMSTADYLQGRGFDVVQAGDASEAIRVLESLHVDVVFSDINMPGGMDGIGLARWIRQHKPAVKVLLTSGKGYPPTDADVFGSLVDKPYRGSEVAARLRAALSPEGNGFGAIRQAS